MSLGILSLVGVLIGIEFTLRIIDYLYTRKGCCMGNDKKAEQRHKKVEKGREAVKES